MGRPEETAGPPEVPPPFFIAGFQRSGTTLLRLMLDNHPEVAIPLDVTGLWSRYYAALGKYNGLATKADAKRMIVDLVAEERIRLWEVPLDPDELLASASAPSYPDIVAAFYRSYAAYKGKVRWGDKDPGNTTRIDQLHRWFPDCKIIHIIRDGRDACLSQLEREDFGHKDLLNCACDWREKVQWVRRMGVLIGPARYAEVRYEDLVRSPDGELRKLCDFLGLDFSEDMMNYHNNVRQSIPDSKRHIWPKIGSPPQARNAGRWKSRLSAGQQICFAKRAGSVLRDLGYEVPPAPWSGGYLAEIGSAAGHIWRALGQKVGGARRRGRDAGGENTR